MPETKLTINGRKNVRLIPLSRFVSAWVTHFLRHSTTQVPGLSWNPTLVVRARNWTVFLSHAIPVHHTLKPTVHRPHDHTTIHVRNATEAHEQDTAVNDELLLPTVTAFAQCTRSPHTLVGSAWHFQFACTTHTDWVVCTGPQRLFALEKADCALFVISSWCNPVKNTPGWSDVFFCVIIFV